MNYVEVGETALSLARRIAPGLTESAAAALSREGTALLERSGFLARIDSNHTVARLLTDMAKEAMPAIQRVAGSGSHAGGDLLVVGKPFRSAIGSEAVPRAQSLVVYEPHQNISIHPDGQFRIDYPTPSGQRIRSDNYTPNGNWLGNSYSAATADGYGRVPSLLVAQDGINATVVSQLGSRQLMFDNAWNTARPNFSINPVIEKFIRESKPITGLPDMSNLMARTVSTPLADGKLIGFDKISGEALVTQEGFHSTGQFGDSGDMAKRLGLPYPVRLTFADDLQVNAFRSPSGRLQPFALKNNGSLFQSPDITVFAFSPLEVKLNGQTLTDILGLDRATGLRAMGGYSTIDGARIPVVRNLVSHAPSLVPENAPKAYLDPIPKEGHKIKAAPASSEPHFRPAQPSRPIPTPDILAQPPRPIPPPQRPYASAEEIARPYASAEEVARPRPHLKPPPIAGTPMPIQEKLAPSPRAESSLKSIGYSSPFSSPF